MKKLMSFVCAALFAFSFCAVMPSNAFSADPNRQEVEKRFELNSATAELELPKDQMDKLRWNTTIQGIASDCNC